jgi:hypothetical protein
LQYVVHWDDNIEYRYRGVSRSTEDILKAKVLGLVYTEGDFDLWAMEGGTAEEVAEIQRYYVDTYGDHPAWKNLPVSVYRRD